MKSNGGIIGAGDTRRRRVRYPSVSGIWTPNDFVNWKKGGYPQDAKSDLIFHKAADWPWVSENGSNVDKDQDYLYTDTTIELNFGTNHTFSADNVLGDNDGALEYGSTAARYESLNRGLYIGPPINSQKLVIFGIGYNQGDLGANSEVLVTSARLSTVNIQAEGETSATAATIIEQRQANDDYAYRQRVGFAYRTVPAMTEYISRVSINFSTSFDATLNNDEGVVLFTYVIEQTGTEEILTVWQTTEIRNTDTGDPISVTTPDPYNGHTILLGTMWSTNATFDWAGNGSQSSGFSSDGKYKSQRDNQIDEAIWQTASRSTTTGGALSTYSFPYAAWGMLTAVCLSTGRDYEAILGSYDNASGQGVRKYVPPTETITTIPSTSATQYTDDGTSDFLLAVDISNFNHLDDGVIFDLGRGYNVNQGATTNKGISMAMQSGELRVNVGVGNDTFDGVSNTGFDIEISVPSTTMDNYTGEEKITLYFMLDRKVASDPDARIYIQPGGRGSTTTATLVGSSNDAVPSELWTASYGYPGYGGQSSDSLSGPADLNLTGDVYPDYAGNITEMRVWINESNLRTKQRFTTIVDVTAESL